MGRVRSAEQIARVLLSNAVRYDTWECRKSRDGAVGPMLTLQLAWKNWPDGPPFDDAIALNMTFFDKSVGSFIGATYTIPRFARTEPVTFQCRTDNILLVVEVVERDERPNASVEGRRVTLWGFTPVSSLLSKDFIVLTPGSAEMLRIDEKSWPSEPRKEFRLEYTCSTETSGALVELLSQLVPPGVVVPQNFTRSTPPASAKSFRCVVRNIQLLPAAAEEDASWLHGAAEWRIAAVAHNGYQQLGQGAEVALVENMSKGRTGSSSDTMSIHDVSVEDSSPQGHLYSTASMEFDGLLVHSTTSLVLAIRRRKVGESSFEVLGFCVFPLCVMPLENHDVRVENLPALNGPFSCRDPRLLMSDSASPYGKLPIAVTMTLEYYPDTVKTSGTSEMDEAASSIGGTEEKRLKEGASSVSHRRRHSGEYPGAVEPSPFTQLTQPIEVLSTEEDAGLIIKKEKIHPPPIGTLPAVELTYPTAATTTTTTTAAAAAAASSIDIFKMLCNIMEELRHLRELQDEVTKQHKARAHPTRQQLHDVGGQLDDMSAVDIVDLAPHCNAISWETRCRLQEDMQPILHPVRGTCLDDSVPASGAMAASLFGIRFEGITADASLNIPEDVCFMFSFGPLPHQTLGPIHTVCIEKNLMSRTFKLYERAQRGGIVWCEPIESAEDPFMRKFHQSTDATVYLHVYDALTMFYVGSANVSLSHFRRPYNAESAVIPLDLILYKDLSLTEQTLPSKVFPLMRNAGQVHVTLFCVGVACPDKNTAITTHTVVEPPRGSRVIVAKRLSHASAMTNNISIASIDSNEERGTDSKGADGEVPTAEHGDVHTDMHWRRVQYIKQTYSTGTLVPGVPPEHNVRDADLEFRLRYLDRQRDEAKSRRIAEALMERLTVRHTLCVASCRPETTRTAFQNPFAAAMQFIVEIDHSSEDALEMKSSPSFYLGPREKADIFVIVRRRHHHHSSYYSNSNYRHEKGSSESRGAMNNAKDEVRQLRARVYTDRRELVRIIDISVSVGPPLVDRRYEIYGPPGTSVSKRIFSRLFSSASFPLTADRTQLLTRMRDLCAHITLTSSDTTAEANAILDPITQTYVTAWEEITVHATIPNNTDTQRVEYLTLFSDVSMSQVIETWEISIFACSAVTSREIFFGQTTAVALPSTGVEALYCSDPTVRVEQRGSSYVMQLRPQEIGTRQMLLHSLTQQHLAKTLLTVPTVYPPPTYMQTLDFSVAETTAPIFRRLHFCHNGPADEVFTVHQNYKYQLKITPKQFALAPGDTQFITLQLDMLCLPEGQMEGRWPMWIFINNAADKTIESYLLQVVVRTHPVVKVMP